jgi:MFS family permease
VALVGVLFLHFAPSALWIYVSTSLIGLGVGATFPIVFNYLAMVFKEMSGPVFSLTIFIGLCGQFTFNKINGIIFDNSQCNYFPIAMAIAVLAIMLLLPLAKSKINNP